MEQSQPAEPNQPRWSEYKGTIFDIKRFSIHDGPGIRTTVFFKGCPLHCTWCHNPESQAVGRELIVSVNRCLGCGGCLAACPHGAISTNGERIRTEAGLCRLCGACVQACYAEARQMVGREATAAEVIAEIERDLPFYDQSGGGVTFSGGEPLLQPAFLLALLQACREREIHTTLDTCGFASWETLERVRPYVNLFLYDVKVMDAGLHERFTGVSNERILSNLHRLAQLGHEIILRFPVIPGINDDPENLQSVGLLALSLPTVTSVSLLPYHRAATSKYERLRKSYTLDPLQPPTAERMAEIARTLTDLGLRVEQ